MLRSSIIFIVSIAIVILNSRHTVAQHIDYRGFPEWAWGHQDSTEYYLYTPVSAGKVKPLPLILFMHGCCGDNYHATLRNAVDSPVRLWHNFGENTQAIPAFILSPKTSRGWTQHFANLKSVMDNLVARKLVDPQRIYISGFSMGAAGTWEFIQAYPNYFAAAIAMGMDFKGTDPFSYPDVPVWAIRGDQDWWARHLGSQVQALRTRFIKNADSLEWHTGINPRLTNFEGMGHVIMWPAVSELALSEWLFSKVNDGNKYPVVVCHTPSFKQMFSKGETVEIDYDAFDPDGKLVSYVLTVNGKVKLNSTKRPVRLTFDAEPGDNEFTITVTDEKGKRTSETGIVRVDVPVEIQAKSIHARAGKYLNQQLAATGNGKIDWAIDQDTSLPEGLVLSNNGVIGGVPTATGKHAIKVTATDEDGDVHNAMIELEVQPKAASQVIVRNVKTHNGKALTLTETRKGVTPHARTDCEVSLSAVPPQFQGLTLIQTEPNDTTTIGTHYVQFEVDAPVIVYVAYEKLGNTFKSSTPPWLNEFRKENGIIAVQYYYYEVYGKEFPAGTITLPHSAEKNSGVNTNYFVMVKKR